MPCCCWSGRSSVRSTRRSDRPQRALCAAIGGQSASNPAGRCRSSASRASRSTDAIASSRRAPSSNPDDVDRREAAARVAGVGRAAWRPTTGSARLCHRGSYGHRAIVDGARPSRSRRQQPVAASTRGGGRRPAPPNGRPETLGESRHHILHRVGRTAPAQSGHHCCRSPKRYCACSSTRPMPGAREKFFTWAGFSRDRWLPVRDGAPGRVTLERCLAAAKAIGDRSAEAWALHELGSRALCLGDAGTARALLSQAVKTA